MSSRVPRWAKLGSRWSCLALALFSATIVTIALPLVSRATPAIQVALLPQQQTVAPGADFYVDLQVTQPSNAGFTAWEGTLVFNPTAVSYVPTVPQSAQQGCLMTGGCSSACGGLYLLIQPGPDSVYVFDGLLCFQTYITGTGPVLRLHFKAANTPSQSPIYFKNLRFYSGGSILDPMLFMGAAVGIGMPALGVDHSETPGGPHVFAAPNPSRQSVVLTVESGQQGEQELSVHDVLGRTIRVLSRSWQAAGTRQLVWDGRDESGSRAAPGVYLVTLRVGNRRTQSHITLLE